MYLTDDLSVEWRAARFSLAAGFLWSARVDIVDSCKSPRRPPLRAKDMINPGLLCSDRCKGIMRKHGCCASYSSMTVRTCC